MASTFTVSNGLEKIAFNEQNNTWGQTLDKNFDLIDESTDGIAAIQMVGSTTINLTPGVSCFARCRELALSGTLASAGRLTITPVFRKIYWVFNGTNQKVVVSNGGPNEVSIDPGKTVPISLLGDGNVYPFMPSTTYNGTVTAFNIDAININGGLASFTPTQFPSPNPNISIVFAECGYLTFGGLVYMQLSGSLTYSAPVDFFYLSVPAAAVHQQALAAAVNGPSVVNANAWTSGGALALGVDVTQVQLNKVYTFSINGWIRLT